MTQRNVHRHLAPATTATILMLLAACGAHWPVKLPLRPTGQISDDYQLEPARALVIAQIAVTTDGQTGFGSISDRMFLQFDEGQGIPKEKAQDLTISDPNALFFTSEAFRPMLWRYARPGLLAMSLHPGTYDGIIVAYPYTARPAWPPESIPAPNRPMMFAPLRIAPQTVVYIGDIQIKQTISRTDLMLDRVKMDYTVVDRYEQTVAHFRSRYPQFQNVEIEKRLAQPLADNG